MIHLLSLFIIGKDVFKHIKRLFIRAIEGEIQSQAVAVDVKEVLYQLRVCFVLFLKVYLPFDKHVYRCSFMVSHIRSSLGTTKGILLVLRKRFMFCLFVLRMD